MSKDWNEAIQDLFAQDKGEPGHLVVGVDVAGPGDDVTVAVFREEDGELTPVTLDLAPYVPRTLELEIELPHPDAELVCVRPLWDGSWAVTLRDRLGVGSYATVTGRAETTLAACWQAGPPLRAQIQKRIEKDRAFANASAARRAALPRPEPYPSGRGVTTALGRASVGRAESQTVSGPYTGSVPRNAASWHCEDGRFRVTLKHGLVWPDTRGTEERVFSTLRIAKDVTRGAVNG